MSITNADQRQISILETTQQTNINKTKCCRRLLNKGNSGVKSNIVKMRSDRTICKDNGKRLWCDLYRHLCSPFPLVSYLMQTEFYVVWQDRRRIHLCRCISIAISILTFLINVIEYEATLNLCLTVCKHMFNY